MKQRSNSLSIESYFRGMREVSQKESDSQEVAIILL